MIGRWRRQDCDDAVVATQVGNRTELVPLALYAAKHDELANKSAPLGLSRAAARRSYRAALPQGVGDGDPRLDAALMSCDDGCDGSAYVATRPRVGRHHSARPRA